MSIKKKTIVVIIGIEAVIIAVMITFLFYMNSDTVKVNRQLVLAQRYLLEEDYEHAIAAYEIVITIDPRNADAYLGLAETYAAADDLENAVKTLEKAAEQIDSDEILAMMENYTAEIEQREQQAALIATEVTQETMVKSQESEITDRVSETGLAVAWTERQESADGSCVVHSFDSNGNCIKLEFYDGDGKLSHYYIYIHIDSSHDSNGYSTKETRSYDGDGTFKGYDIRSYDNNGNLIKEEWYNDENNTFKERNIDSYDNDGNLIKKEVYFGDELSYYYIYNYDSNGKRVKEEQYNENGTLTGYYVYSYDSNGNQIKSELYGYDAFGNLYDASGNIVSD